MANVRRSSFPRRFVEGPAPGAISDLIRVLDGRTPVGYVVVIHFSGDAVTCILDEIAVAEAQRRNGVGGILWQKLRSSCWPKVSRRWTQLH